MLKPIRILHVVGSMNMGGAENFIMNLYRNINREEVQFDFIVHKKGIFDKEILELGGKIFKLNYINKIGPIKYRKELDVFFTSNPQYKIIHSHVDQTSGIILEEAKKFNIPIRIAHSHSTSNNNNIFVKVYKSLLQTKINKFATHKIACSNKAGKWLYKSNDFIVMHNAIDLQKFKFNLNARKKTRKEMKIDDNTLVLGHVGRFSKIKNQLFIIDIFNKINKIKPNSKLILVGDGELREDIENKINEYELNDSVILTGIRKDVHNIYQALDILIFPSLFEGIPVSLIEAQASRPKDNCL